MTSITKHPKSGRIIRVLQITDTHLFANSSGCLLGLNTEQSLQAVITKVRANHLPSDLILATGDLVHDDVAGVHAHVGDEDIDLFLDVDVQRRFIDYEVLVGEG